MSEVTYTFAHPTADILTPDVRDGFESLLRLRAGSKQYNELGRYLAYTINMGILPETANVHNTFRTVPDWHLDGKRNNQELWMFTTSTPAQTAACNLVVSERLQRLVEEKYDKIRKKYLRFPESYTVAFLHDRYDYEWLEAAADPSLRSGEHADIDDLCTVENLDIRFLETFALNHGMNYEFLHRSTVRQPEDPAVRFFGKTLMAYA